MVKKPVKVKSVKLLHQDVLIRILLIKPKEKLVATVGDKKDVDEYDIHPFQAEIIAVSNYVQEHMPEITVGSIIAYDITRVDPNNNGKKIMIDDEVFILIPVYCVNGVLE